MNPSAESSQHTWQTFCDDRLSYVTALAEIVAHGVLRRDTNHPTFCGCIDWHSSVHGVYALLTASRLTGHPHWAEIAESVLVPATLEQELSAIKREELNHELPYGYAWFLKLAGDRERWFGKLDLCPLAEEIAQKLAAWMLSLSEHDAKAHTMNPAYGNLSWALLNLWEWSRLKEQTDLLPELTALVRRHILPLDKYLPPDHDHQVDEFFPASLQRTRTILTILPGEETQPWLESHYPSGLDMRPLPESPRVHSAGLNFSRSWGLWALYQRTGNSSYRDQYVAHITTHMTMPQYWREDYPKYSHWVPQFGIYAIALSIDDVG